MKNDLVEQLPSEGYAFVRGFFDPDEIEPLPPDQFESTRANNIPSVMIAGIGNIFLGDDAFGVEVAQRLARRKLPDRVKVVDFGIRGFDLAYALLDRFDGERKKPPE